MKLKKFLQQMGNESIKINDLITMFENTDTDEILNALFCLHDLEDIENYLQNQKDGMIMAIETALESIDYLVDNKTGKPIDINIFCSKYLGLEDMRIKAFQNNLRSGKFSTGQIVSFFDRIVVNPMFSMMEVTV